jgi:hypothetical protein
MDESLNITGQYPGRLDRTIALEARGVDEDLP